MTSKKSSKYLEMLDLELYTGERPLFDLFNVEDDIEKALERKVNLK